MLNSALFLSAILVLAASCAGPASQKQIGQNITGSATPTNEELRLKTQEQMLRGENHHDGSSILESVGTIESVPALLKVLEDNPPNPNGVMICTTAHAISALKKVTGADPGYTYKAWKSWWDKYQKNQKMSESAPNK